MTNSARTKNKNHLAKLIIIKAAADKHSLYCMLTNWSMHLPRIIRTSTREASKSFSGNSFKDSIKATTTINTCIFLRAAASFHHFLSPWESMEYSSSIPSLICGFLYKYRKMSKGINDACVVAAAITLHRFVIIAGHAMVPRSMNT